MRTAIRALAVGAFAAMTLTAAPYVHAQAATASPKATTKAGTKSKTTSKMKTTSSKSAVPATVTAPKVKTAAPATNIGFDADGIANRGCKCITEVGSRKARRLEQCEGRGNRKVQGRHLLTR